MKTPAHRRRKDRFGKAQIAPRITPRMRETYPRCKPCGKLAYPTNDEAIASTLLQQEAFGSPPLRVYECPAGFGWHHTSKPLREA